jgi:hypothetical protein
MSRANGENLATEEETTGDNTDVAAQVRLAARQHLADNPQQQQVLNALPPQQVQAAVVQVQQQANPAQKRKAPPSEEEKKRARAERFAPELKASAAEEAKKQKTQGAAFVEFDAARGTVLLRGAWQKHMNEDIFRQLIVEFGSFAGLVEHIVASATAAHVSYSEQQGSFEIMIRDVLEAAGARRARDIPTGRYTVAGSVSKDGFTVFHVGKFG